MPRMRGKAAFSDLDRALTRDASFAGRFSYNIIKKEMLVAGRSWTEDDLSELLAALENRYKRFVEPEALRRAVVKVAKLQSFNPVADWLTGLKWDGVPRLALVLEALRIREQHPLHRRYLEIWLSGAVRRALRPREQVDECLVLMGPQGTRKSTTLRVWASGPAEDGSYFFDAYMPTHDKDGNALAASHWIIELQELDGYIRGRAASYMKQFISLQTDKFRPPYARKEEVFHRRCAFAGTTNVREFLIDPTGNRRFMVLPIGGRIDVEALVAVRDQMWAEVTHMVAAGEPKHFSPAEEIEHQNYVEMFVRGGSARARFASLLLGKQNARSRDLQDAVPELSSKEIGRILRELGWEPFKNPVGERCWRGPSGNS